MEKGDIQSQAQSGLQSTQATLEKGVNDARAAIGSALESAAKYVFCKDYLRTMLTGGSSALAVADKKADEGVDAAVGSTASFLDQARNTLASGLKKAEEVVVGAAAKAEDAAQGTKAEPYTSNLMEGAKDAAASIDTAAQKTAATPSVPAPGAH